jgi:2,4-diaminopentanoate dehydrogenase
MLAALRFAVEGIVDGEPVIAVEHANRMRGDLAPEWPSLEPGGGYRIEIEGFKSCSRRFSPLTAWGKRYQLR